ncbi:MAG: type III-B CRISPR module RAMP protein Cmr6 [Bacteroidia bacterium]
MSANPKPNLGWLFYKRNFEKLPDWLDETDRISGQSERKKKLNERSARFYKEFNKKFTGRKLDDSTPEAPAGSNDFQLRTTYPGLLIGGGYSHETGLEGEYKLGFHFDYTSGLPYIPGSSVKGVLRSVFIDAPDFTKELLKQPLDGSSGDDLNEAQLRKLEVQLFGPRQKDHDQKPEAGSKAVFHDAFPIAAHARGGHFLGNDFITPHINRKTPALSQFTDPIPLQFLKVLPEVDFRFVFSIQNIGIEGQIIKKETTLRLFKDILLLMGIGAKTNVGYGQFVDPESPDILESLGRDSTITAKSSDFTISSEAAAPAQKKQVTRKSWTRLKRSEVLTGTVINNADKHFVVKLDIDNLDEPVEFDYPASHIFPPGSRIRVRYEKRGNDIKLSFGGRATD